MQYLHETFGRGGFPKIRNTAPKYSPNYYNPYCKNQRRVHTISPGWCGYVKPHTLNPKLYALRLKIVQKPSRIRLLGPRNLKRRVLGPLGIYSTS